MSSTELLNIQEVCTLLRLTKARIYQLIQARRENKGTFPLPVSKPNCLLAWDRNDIEGYLFQRAAVSKSPVVRSARIRLLESEVTELKRQMFELNTKIAKSDERFKLHVEETKNLKKQLNTLQFALAYGAVNQAEKDSAAAKLADVIQDMGYSAGAQQIGESE